jgi:predicted kinase
MEAIIFIGIQAAGKSTFYKERFFDSHIRINLDMLRTRNRESILLTACIKAKQKFVIDNTNITREQRVKYIEPARAGQFTIIGYYFDTNVAESTARNNQRSGKACVPTVAIGSSYRKLEKPSLMEGFDRIYQVKIDQHNNFIVEDYHEV